MSQTYLSKVFWSRRAKWRRWHQSSNPSIEPWSGFEVHDDCQLSLCSFNTRTKVTIIAKACARLWQWCSALGRHRGMASKWRGEFPTAPVVTVGVWIFRWFESHCRNSHLWIAKQTKRKWKKETVWRILKVQNKWSRSASATLWLYRKVERMCLCRLKDAFRWCIRRIGVPQWKSS